MNVPRATYSLSTSFCAVPGDLLARDALLVGDRDVHRDQHRRRRVDGHRGRDPVERDAVEDRLHVGQRVDRHADLADLAGRAVVVGVEPHLGRQVEGGREPRLALREQELEALVGRLGRAEAGVLADRPVAAAVHRRLDAARERVLAGEAEVALVVEVAGRARACRCGRSGGRRGSRTPRGARRTSRARWRAGPPPSAAGRCAAAPSSFSLERISSSSSALPLPRPLPSASVACRITLGHARASFQRSRCESNGVGNVRAMGGLPDASLIDVLQTGRERVIGAWDLGGAIVDPGPESRIETLLAELTEPPRALLLTHIHLDHAGADRRAGRALPGPRGLGARPRRAAPDRSERGCSRARRASTATRWARCGAACVPVPERNLRVLEGGETIARRRPRVRGRVCAGPRLPPRRVLRRLRRHRLRRRRRRRADPAVRLRATADAAAGHRRRGSGSARSTRSSSMSPRSWR